MIDISLTDQSVIVEDYEFFDMPCPSLFLGFAIKNEYDNQRLHINEDYHPEKRLFLLRTEQNKYTLIPLYGIFLPLNKLGLNLSKILYEQDKLTDTKIDINQYETILSEYNMTCHDSYSYLNNSIYPIDLKHFTEITDDILSEDDKILQHLLSLDEDKFNFQQFGAFKLLILEKTVKV